MPRLCLCKYHIIYIYYVGFYHVHFQKKTTEAHLAPYASLCTSDRARPCNMARKYLGNAFNMSLSLSLSVTVAIVLTVVIVVVVAMLLR